MALALFVTSFPNSTNPAFTCLHSVYSILVYTWPQNPYPVLWWETNSLLGSHFLKECLSLALQNSTKMLFSHVWKKRLCVCSCPVRMQFTCNFIRFLYDLRTMLDGLFIALKSISFIYLILKMLFGCKVKALLKTHLLWILPHLFCFFWLVSPYLIYPFLQHTLRTQHCYLEPFTHTHEDTQAFVAADTDLSQAEDVLKTW